jgi:hypothetical protein
LAGLPLSLAAGYLMVALPAVLLLLLLMAVMVVVSNTAAAAAAALRVAYAEYSSFAYFAAESIEMAPSVAVIMHSSSTAA